MTYVALFTELICSSKPNLSINCIPTPYYHVDTASQLVGFFNLLLCLLATFNVMGAALVYLPSSRMVPWYAVFRTSDLCLSPGVSEQAPLRHRLTTSCTIQPLSPSLFCQPCHRSRSREGTICLRPPQFNRCGKCCPGTIINNLMVTW